MTANTSRGTPASRDTPANYIVYGAGGVGKTTTAAALGVAFAARGARTLVATTDPARRLAHALSLPAHTDVAPVPWAPGLDYYMPEAGATTRAVVDAMLADFPDVAASLAGNPVFELLCSGLAGMHELAALASLAPIAARYDVVVIDTAPSRHALDLVTLPRRIAALIDSRALVWLGQLSEDRLAERRGLSRRLIDWGQRRLVGRFESALGGTAVASCMEVLRAMAVLRPLLSARAQAAGSLLTGPRTEHVVVLAPRAGAAEEARVFSDELALTARRPSLYIVNRVPEIATWAQTLIATPTLPALLRDAAQVALDESTTRSAAAARVTVALAAEAGEVVHVPAFDAVHPEAVVAAIAARFTSVLPEVRPARAAS